ncbi:MAG TPA: GIY-YIG nuclease family protein [Xanthobacteraceae bacterium]
MLAVRPFTRERSQVQSQQPPPAFAASQLRLASPSSTLSCEAAKAAGATRRQKTVEFPDETYVGLTDDLRARFTAHNSGRSPHTAKYKPCRLVTYIAFSNEQKAGTLPSNSARNEARKRRWQTGKSQFSMSWTSRLGGSGHAIRPAKAARVHRICRQHGGCMADRGACAEGADPGGRCA